MVYFQLKGFASLFLHTKPNYNFNLELLHVNAVISQNNLSNLKNKVTHVCKISKFNLKILCEYSAGLLIFICINFLRSYRKYMEL